MKDQLDDFLENMIKADTVAKTCENCKFSKKQLGPGGTHTGYFLCLRFPPIYGWPVVKPDDCCGEYQP
jgi:hypothetical protein